MFLVGLTDVCCCEPTNCVHRGKWRAVATVGHGHDGQASTEPTWKKLRGDDRVSSNKAMVSFCTFCRQILYLDTEKYLHSETSDARCSLGYTTYTSCTSNHAEISMFSIFKETAWQNWNDELRTTLHPVESTSWKSSNKVTWKRRCCESWGMFAIECDT